MKRRSVVIRIGNRSDQGFFLYGDGIDSLNLGKSKTGSVLVVIRIFVLYRLVVAEHFLPVEAQ